MLDGATAELLSRGHESAILVNGDSPTLPATLLIETVLALREPGVEAVFVPALDGGESALRQQLGMGAALVYYIMLPFVLWFSLSQQISSGNIQVELLPRVSDYLDLVTKLLLAFGLCFQLPVVLSLAGLAGLLTSRQLMDVRRYALLAIVFVAALVTPPDPISQLMLAIPIYLLYEISIWCVKLIELRRRDDDRSNDGEGRSLIPG